MQRSVLPADTIWNNLVRKGAMFEPVIDSMLGPSRSWPAAIIAELVIGARRGRWPAITQDACGPPLADEQAPC